MAYADGTESPEAARAAVLGHFRWVHGHADIWPVFGDPAALRSVVLALAAPFRGGVDVVAAVEARAFLLAGAVAVELGVGVAAIRQVSTPTWAPAIGASPHGADPRRLTSPSSTPC